LQHRTRPIAILFTLDVHLLRSILIENNSYTAVFWPVPSASFLMTMLHHFDLEALWDNKGFYPIIMDDYKLLTEYLVGDFTVMKGIYTGYDMLHTAPYGEVYSTEFSYIREKLKKAFMLNLIDISTHALGGMMMYANEFKNLSKLATCPSTDILVHIAKGKPVICVAAGPSLDKNIDYLYEIQDEVIIIAVASVIKPLLNHNIKADIAVVVDMQPEVCRYFDDIDPDLIPPVMVELTASHEVFDRIPNAIISISSILRRNFVKNVLAYLEYQSFGVVGSAFNVAFSAILLANFMGAKDIIVLGLDLAFSDTSNYVKGAKFESAIEIMEIQGKKYIKMNQWDTEKKVIEPLYEAPGYFGGTVYASNIFDKYRLWLEKFVIDNKVNVINSTEGGVYVEGLEHISLKEAYIKYIKDNPSVYEPRDYTSLSIYSSMIDKNLHKIEAILERYHRLKVYCEEQLKVLETVQTYILDVNKARDNAFFNLLRKINESPVYISHKYKDEVAYIAENSTPLYCRFKMRKDQRLDKKDSDAQFIDIYEINVLYLSYIIEGCEFYIPILDDFISTVSAIPDQCEKEEKETV
jgi:hypothetical protein